MLSQPMFEEHSPSSSEKCNAQKLENWINFDLSSEHEYMNSEDSMDSSRFEFTSSEEEWSSSVRTFGDEFGSPAFSSFGAEEDDWGFDGDVSNEDNSNDSSTSPITSVSSMDEGLSTLHRAMMPLFTMFASNLWETPALAPGFMIVTFITLCACIRRVRSPGEKTKTMDILAKYMDACEKNMTAASSTFDKLRYMNRLKYPNCARWKVFLIETVRGFDVRYAQVRAGTVKGSDPLAEMVARTAGAMIRRAGISQVKIGKFVDMATPAIGLTLSDLKIKQYK